MPIQDYSTDPDLNVQISGINIAEGCPPSGINNAIRQLMADVKVESEAKAEAITAVGEALDEAISTKVSSVNGLAPDADGNVDVGGMPLGTLLPYTGKDVPAGTLRADGSTYTNMRNSFPEFYNWVVQSGLTKPLTEYTLVEGSCGFYGLDEATGTVRMPTLAAGIFGTTVAGQYGMAVEAGLPEIAGAIGNLDVWGFGNVAVRHAVGAFYLSGEQNSLGRSVTIQSQSTSPDHRVASFNASRFNPIYSKSDTVTPSHVKYPWVIVVYNAAVSASVAQAQEFIGLLDGKADKAQVTEGLATAVAPGFVMPFAANSTPSGYLLCNGAAVSRTTYAALFSAIGTTYGAGDGSTTFNLPNLTDKFIQGSGTAGTVKAAGLPEIWGQIKASFLGTSTVPQQDGVLSCAYEGSNWLGTKDGFGYVINDLQFKASLCNPIFNNSNTVQPPAVTMRYYIKY